MNAQVLSDDKQIGASCAGTIYTMETGQCCKPELFIPPGNGSLSRARVCPCTAVVLVPDAGQGSHLAGQKWAAGQLHQIVLELGVLDRRVPGKAGACPETRGGTQSLAQE